MRLNYDPAAGVHDDSVEVLSVATDIGVSDGVYVDRGIHIDAMGFNRILVYFDIVPNSSTGLWVKALIGHNESDINYDLPFTSGGEAEIKGTVVAGVLKATVEFILDGLVPYVQLQTKAVALGAPKATVKMVVLKAWV